MTIRTLNGTYTATYSLVSPVTTLSITAAGYLGAGLAATGAGTYSIVNAGEIVAAVQAIGLAGPGSITNTGTIRSTDAADGAGIVLNAGGAVDNGSAGALIAGYVGVKVAGGSGTVVNRGAIEAIAMGVAFEEGQGTVANYGLIRAVGTTGAGVFLNAGGTVTNGSGASSGALIEGIDGVLAASGAVDNFGTIRGRPQGATATYGVSLTAGGVVTNGSAQDLTALIEGPGGIAIAGAAGTVTNFGTIIASTGEAVALLSGGVVTNGSAADRSARIQGRVLVEFPLATVNNFGTMTAGVVFETAGVLVNGSDADTTALIEGYGGVAAPKAALTIHNFGTIRGGLGVGRPQFAEGVLDVFGGNVTNGDAADTTAVIEGPVGVYLANATGTVTNFATISDRAVYAGVPYGGSGVLLGAGGLITNGGAALIRGHVVGAGIAGASGTIKNFGTIRGGVMKGVGASLAAGGLVANGSAADTAALITGLYGVVTSGAAATVINDGTITATAGSPSAASIGVRLGAGGAVTNGSASLTTALIEGYVGLSLLGTAAAANFGTILGGNVVLAYGAEVLGSASRLTNGSAADATALISGYAGVLVGAGDTLTNFATVQGVGQYAVQMVDATSRLYAEAGSAFKGIIAGAGGLIDFVGGVSSAGGLRSSGLVTGAGTVSLSGVSEFDAGAKLTVARVILSGAATQVNVATSLADAKVWTQNAGTVTVAAGKGLTFTGVGDQFTGTLAGAGLVVFAGGSDLLQDVVLSAASVVINGASVTLGGQITLSGPLTATTANLVVASTGATLAGGGSLVLSNLATNKVKGASASATLTNSDRIFGAGNLGGGTMVLVNTASGLIDADDSVALTIDAGASTIANAGIIEATGAGGLTIKSAIASGGTLAVTTGTLADLGAVTGSGTVKIAGGTADFAGAFGQNVAFTKTIGVLELANSQAYAGTVTGFSKTGTTSLDLLDITFGASTKASYAGTTASGTLTVTDGAHTATIKLAGDFTASIFTVSDDGHGGTTVIDPHRPAAHAFLAAAAAFGAPAAGSTHLPVEPPRPWLELAGPGAHSIRTASFG